MSGNRGSSLDYRGSFLVMALTMSSDLDPIVIATLMMDYQLLYYFSRDRS